MEQETIREILCEGCPDYPMEDCPCGCLKKNCGTTLESSKQNSKMERRPPMALQPNPLQQYNPGVDWQQRCCITSADNALNRPDPYRCCEIGGQRAYFYENKARFARYGRDAARAGVPMGRLNGFLR